ncbi:hypothetical protein [Agaribacter marinus]|uniref:Uncharacterized protein n=1 Tax=Agaribacter marinus TaxID=1431249 RepID=A0AA37WJJ6_9ALTE|nr:hypothetical protein [Agaribacter marinus]GLR72212.1 hypothetical protein GCM10007852_31200 [Agaribacter marinus]
MLSLQNVMRANALSCLVFGLLFSIYPSSVAEYVGGTSPAPQSVVMVLGVTLVFNGFHLLWASNLALPNKLLVLYFSMGDFIWVIASLGLMMAGFWVTTINGIVAASAVAVMVGIFGVLQLYIRKGASHSKAIHS